MYSNTWKILGVFSFCSLFSVSNAIYYGKLVGKLNARGGDIVGDVYAVDSRTIHIRGLEFDGQDPDAVFYAGSSPKPSADGFVVPSERGTVNTLRAYRGEHITLTLPEGRSLKDVRWLSVWSRSRGASLADVKIPTNFDYPKPQKLSALNGEHLVGSDRIVVVDAQTFLIPNFTYDGSAPDALFWVGKGSKPGPEGTNVPDENGGIQPLKRYDAKTLVLTLTEGLTIFDIEYFGIWCKNFFVDFGHIRIPKKLNVPPSLKMLGVSPQTKLNCEVLFDDLALEVRWALAGESIVMQLVGKLENSQYMSFGLSGDLKSSRMVGGDVIIAWYDRETGKGHAEDYFLDSKAQCAGNRGVCPDTSLQGGSNNVRLLNTAVINDFVMVTYQRPLRAVDDGDKQIFTNQSQAVIWAIGPLNSQGKPSYHNKRTDSSMLINFGRQPFWNCPYPEEPESETSPPLIRADPQPPTRPEVRAPVPAPAPIRPSAPVRSEAPVRAQAPARVSAPVRSEAPVRAVASKPTPTPAKPWFIPPIPCHEPEDHIFYAHVGPTGGDQGYSAITGHVGWGIAWYINGLLIPEITVVRGTTYSFVVEGGNDGERPAKNHPFYITDDPEGGYAHKSEEERENIRVFAGVRFNQEGQANPTGAGRLCEWTQTTKDAPEQYSSFGAYQRTLKLNCEEGQPAVVKWRPDENTPDTVYYQCFTHRYLGYRIRVVDRCDTKLLSRRVDASANEKQEFDDYDYDAEADEPLRVGQTQNRPIKPSGATHNKANPFPDKFPSFEQNFPDFPSFGGFPSDFEDNKGNKFFGSDKEGPSKVSPAKESYSTNDLSNRRPSAPQPPPIQKVSTPERSSERSVTNSMGDLPLAEQQRPLPSLPPFSSPKSADKFNSVTERIQGSTTEKNFKSYSQADKAKATSPPKTRGSSNAEDSEEDDYENDDTTTAPPRGSLNKYKDISQKRDQARQPSWNEPQRPKATTRYDQPKLAPSAVDSNFNPSSIVFETGFKPIKNTNGPIPPLGFEVSDQSLAGSARKDFEPVYQTPKTISLNFDPMFKASELETVAKDGRVQNILSQPISAGKPHFAGETRETFRLDAVPPPAQVNFRPERLPGYVAPKIEGLSQGPDGKFFLGAPPGGQFPPRGLPPGAQPFERNGPSIHKSKKPSFFENVGSFFGFGGDRRQDKPSERQVIPPLPPSRPGVQILPANGDFRPPPIPQIASPQNRPLLQQPQLAPFRGELPPPVPINPGNLVQFQQQQQQPRPQQVKFPGPLVYRGLQDRSDSDETKGHPTSAEKNYGQIRINPHESEGFSQVIGAKISFGGKGELPTLRGTVEDVHIAARQGLPASRSIDVNKLVNPSSGELTRSDNTTDYLILADVWSKIETDEHRSGPDVHQFRIKDREERKIRIRREEVESKDLPMEHRGGGEEFEEVVDYDIKAEMPELVFNSSPLKYLSTILFLLPILRALL